MGDKTAARPATISIADGSARLKAAKFKPQLENVAGVGWQLWHSLKGTPVLIQVAEDCYWLENIENALVGLSRSAISQWGRKEKPTTPKVKHIRWAETALRVPLLKYLLLDEEGQQPRRPFIPPRRVK
jgi:transcriptional regulator with XRE-family HTH domain